MDEYLFDKFLYNGVHTKKAKDLMKMLDKKGFVDKINSSHKIPRGDIHSILEYWGTTFFEYTLLLRFIKNQPINYKESSVQEAILKHKSLSEFALIDKNCPQELKDKIPSHIKSQPPPLSLEEVIRQTGKPITISQEPEIYTNIKPSIKYIKTKNDTEFSKEKERCYELLKDYFGSASNIDINAYKLEQNIKDCAKVCYYTDDIEYKKAFYTTINEFNLSKSIASIIAQNIHIEENKDVLLHIFRNCPRIFEQQTGFMNDTAIVFEVRYNPAIDKDILKELINHYSAEDYCQNKVNLCIAELLIENDIFPIDAYEYYAKNRNFGSSYRNKNADIIQDEILYAKNTPKNIIKLLTEQKRDISIPAEIRLTTGMYDEQLRRISDAIFYDNLNAFYSLDDNTRKQVATALLECYAPINIITALCLNNNEYPITETKTGIVNMVAHLLETNGYKSYDPIVGYNIIKEYENSKCFKYVMAEREYLNCKNVEKASQAQTLADDVLSDEPTPINLTSSISIDTIEL